jgi:hypothetical protein
LAGSRPKRQRARYFGWETQQPKGYHEGIDNREPFAKSQYKQLLELFCLRD